MDLMDPPAGMLAFLRRMHTFYCDLLEKWAETDVDALNFMDDWGAQRSLLIPPEMWRRSTRPGIRCRFCKCESGMTNRLPARGGGFCAAPRPLGADAETLQ